MQHRAYIQKKKLKTGVLVGTVFVSQQLDHLLRLSFCGPIKLLGEDRQIRVIVLHDVHLFLVNKTIVGK